MKFKQYIHEMTIKAGILNHLSSIFDQYIENDLYKNSTTKIADIEKFEIYETDYTNLFLIKYKEEPVGYFMLTEKVYGIQLENIFVHEKYKSNNLFAKVCWFLKRFKNTDKIFLGDVHSAATVNILNKFIDNKKFNIKWYDIKTKEYSEFDEKLYGISDKTDLIACLENKADHSNYPMFSESIYDFKLLHLYDLVN